MVRLIFGRSRARFSLTPEECTMNVERPYWNRRDAGRILAAHVRHAVRADGNVVVLALPRGGVPVGLEVAQALRAPLDVVVARKLGVPDQREFAMGAIASGGYEVLDQSLIEKLGISPLEIAAVADRETSELRRREELYHAERPTIHVHGKIAVLVDDGLATGFTIRAAIAAARGRGAAKIVVAVPVGAPESCVDLSRDVDWLICPLQPADFSAVGFWYHDFAPTSDDEVCECLDAANLSLRP